MAEILKPETNVPYELAMKFDTPKLVDSQLNGEKQAMITLVDGRIVYAPTFVADRLADMGIRRNDPFVLCRREVRTETGKALRWEVKPIETAKPEFVPPARPAAAPRTATNSQQNQQHANGSAPAPLAAVPVRSAPAPAMHCMCAAMCAAVDAIIETQAYAARKGLGVTFSEESVRAIGLSIYINDCKGGAR